MAKKGRVGALSVSLSLNSAQFSAALTKARKRTARFGKAIATNTIRLAKWGAAIGAAGVAIGVYFTRQSMKSIDALAKWSDRLGVSTQKLAGLQHAAALSGVRAETFNVALQRMTRRFAEAARGSGEAKDAIAELGLDAAAVSKLPVDAKMKTIADAFQRVKGQGDRVRLAFKLFDSEGVALVNTLKLGSAGLEMMQREADKLGISLTRLDAKKVEMANDAIQRLKGVFRGVGHVLAIKVAPIVTRIVNKFISAGTEGEGLGSIVERACDRAIRGLERLGDTLDNIIYSFRVLRLFMNDVYKRLNELINLGARAGQMMKSLPGAGVWKASVKAAGRAPLTATIRGTRQFREGLRLDTAAIQKQIEDAAYSQMRGGGIGGAVRSVTRPAATDAQAAAQRAEQIELLRQLTMSITLVGNLG